MGKGRNLVFLEGLPPSQELYGLWWDGDCSKMWFDLRSATPTTCDQYNRKIYSWTWSRSVSHFNKVSYVDEILCERSLCLYALKATTRYDNPFLQRKDGYWAFSYTRNWIELGS